MAARRIEGLQIERVADEILASKPGAPAAHALNQTAAIVFDLCDGEHSKSEMAAAIQHQTGLPADLRVVDLALDGLIKAGLVVRDASWTEASVTRRALIGVLSLSGAAIALLPVVEAISLAPARTTEAEAPRRLAQRPPGVGQPPGTGGGGGGQPPGTGKPPGTGGGRPPGTFRA